MPLQCDITEGKTGIPLISTDITLKSTDITLKSTDITLIQPILTCDDSGLTIVLFMMMASKLFQTAKFEKNF